MTIVRIDIEPVRGTGNQRYRVSCEGKTLIARARDPEHEAARALKQLGVSGLMQTFVRGRASMVLEIESAASCTVIENSRGVRLERWRPIDTTKLCRLRVPHTGLHAQTAKAESLATIQANDEDGQQRSDVCTAIIAHRRP